MIERSPLAIDPKLMNFLVQIGVYQRHTLVDSLLRASGRTSGELLFPLYFLQDPSDRLIRIGLDRAAAFILSFNGQNEEHILSLEPSEEMLIGAGGLNGNGSLRQQVVLGILDGLGVREDLFSPPQGPSDQMIDQLPLDELGIRALPRDREAVCKILITQVAKTIISGFFVRRTTVRQGYEAEEVLQSLFPAMDKSKVYKHPAGGVHELLAGDICDI